MRRIYRFGERGGLLSFTPDSITAGPFLAVLGNMKPAQLGTLNADQCEQIYNEIAVALLDFMFERPAAKDVLRGRTFVRTLH